MKVNLVAVQAKPVISDYADAESFYRKMASLMDQAASKVDFSQPTLVVFPEGIGLPLAFVPQTYGQFGDAKTIARVFIRAVPKNLPRFLGAILKYRTSTFRAVFLETALEAEDIYTSTFSTLAREHGVYLCGGCIYLQHIEDEAVKGRHIVGRAVYNQSYLFNPQGVCLRRTPKINLAPPTEPRFGFSPGNRSDVMPIDTKIGRLGTLVCYDAFHRSLIERVDAMGVEILINPSHNERRWEARAGFNPAITVGEAWMQHGLPTMIQGREHLRYGISPMLVGPVFDVKSHGQSRICRNLSRPGADPHESLLAEAAVDEEDIIYATVEVRGHIGTNGHNATSELLDHTFIDRIRRA
ncbi:MAG: carbon-nitrogen hydrolase family protein [Chloroflexi bacterium]|nr:carbon-nitrogen hydrolase family protein [Chloroflexota bacterium]